MTIETSLAAPHKIAASFTSATLSIELIAIRHKARMSGQMLPRSRIAAAMLALSLAAGVIVHPTVSVDVQVLTPYVIGLSELDELYNYTDLLGRYIVTADGFVFEVKEV